MKWSKDELRRTKTKRHDDKKQQDKKIRKDYSKTQKDSRRVPMNWDGLVWTQYELRLAKTRLKENIIYTYIQNKIQYTGLRWIPNKFQ